MERRGLVMALLFLGFSMLAVSLACGGSVQETPASLPTISEEVVATMTATPPGAELPTQAPPTSPTPTLAPLGTTIDRPVPLGSSLTAANGAKITIKGIVARGAEAIAMLGVFSSDPSEGKEYVSVSGSVTYEGGEAETLSIGHWSFRAVVNRVIVDASLAQVAEEPLQGEMFAGGTIDGHLLFEVDEGATGIVLIYTVPWNESYYFATE